MKKLLGYALMVVFAILILAGSTALMGVPYRQAVAELQAFQPAIMSFIYRNRRSVSLQPLFEFLPLLQGVAAHRHS